MSESGHEAQFGHFRCSPKTGHGFKRLDMTLSAIRYRGILPEGRPMSAMPPIATFQGMGPN